jgi:cation/acetate symporter
MGIVFIYAVLGGMKGITYTQVAQYCVLIFAYLVPAFFISFMLTGNPVPQLGLGSQLNDGSGIYVLQKLDLVVQDLGFAAYTAGTKSMIDVFCITAALMVGTAGLPHVIVRFFTVPRASDARKSAGWALLFIALLYTTAPAVGAFARLNFTESVNEIAYADAPGWFTNWEANDLIAFRDRNGDGVMQYRSGNAFDGAPLFTGERGSSGERLVGNEDVPGGTNEVYVDRDIMVLANPEIANLPGWVIALVAAGGLAAALSTAAGLLLVISSAVSHDLLKQTFRPQITEKGELAAARIAATAAILVAGYLGIYPPGWVAEVVAFAFGLAAASLFPAIFLGIFTRWMNRAGAIAGMVTGLSFTFLYIAYFKFWEPAANVQANWLFGISPEGIGVIGMLLNFAVAAAVAKVTTRPPADVDRLVSMIRVP